MSEIAKPARRPRPHHFPPRPVSSDTPLRARERRFVEEYLACLNGAKAATQAGYSAKTARVTASKLLTKANIAAALETGYKEREKRTLITSDSTVRAIACLAHSDIRKFYDANGDLIPIHSLPDELAACIASIEVVKRNLTSGDGKTERVWKIKLWSKPQALELLGRHQGLFREDPPSDAPDVPAFALPPETPGVRCH
jgi:phage terminase small subunit